MTAEQQNTPEQIPEWVREERQVNLSRIHENMEIFFLAASAAHEDAGRSAIVVDTTQQPIESLGHPFGYFSQKQVDPATKTPNKSDKFTMHYLWEFEMSYLRTRQTEAALVPMKSRPGLRQKGLFALT